MRLNYLFLYVEKSRKLQSCFRSYLKATCLCKYVASVPHTNSFSTSAILNARIGDGEIDLEADLDYNLESYSTLVDHNYARDLLYKNSRDVLLQRIYKCASIQELFKVFKSSSKDFNCHHITQTVLVLHDFKKIYQSIHSSNVTELEKSSIQFLNKLEQNRHFTDFLNLIDKKINQFGYTTLSYTMLYLNKLGLKVSSPTIQLLTQTLEKSLLVKFLISPASRYLQTAFSEVNLRSYYMSQNLIPLVFNEIGKNIA